VAGKSREGMTGAIVEEKRRKMGEENVT